MVATDGGAVHLRWVRRSAAVASVVFLACLVFRPGGRFATEVVDDVGSGVAAAAAAVGCFVAARSRRTNRLGWLLVAWGCTAWTVGEAVWSWYEIGLRHEVPFPSLADIGYLAFVPLVVIGVLTFVRTPAGVYSRLRAVSEASLICAGALFVSWALVLHTAFGSKGSSGGPLAQWISLAYPISDLAMLSVVLFAVSKCERDNRRPLALLGWGIAAIAVSDSAFTYLTQAGSYGTSQLIDAGWFAGFMLIAVASRESGTSARERVTSGRLTVLAAYLPLGVAALVGAARLVSGQGFDAVLGWDTVAMLVLVVVHEVPVRLENHALTTVLERRVQARTAALAAQERHFRALVEHSSDVVTVVDGELRIREVTPSVEAVFGYSVAQLVGRPVADVVVPDERDVVVAALQRAAQLPGGTLTVECALVDATGRTRHTETTASNLLHEDAVRGLVLNTRDITDRKLLEDELRHQAFHDSLTGLANRALFRDRTDHALQRCRRQAATVGMLFVDLDGFKMVNDSLGHETGDELLMAVAERLRSCVRPGDTVARLGGDEFGILLEEIDDRDSAVSVADRLLAALAEPLTIGDHDHVVRASVGIAFGGSLTAGAHELLRDADTAMYEAKANGRGRYELFEKRMHERATEQLALHAELRRAVDQGQFVLHYQPSIDLESGRLEGFEALVRWQHPTRGLIGPERFVAAAEDSGLIVPLGRWVLHEACHEAIGWFERHPDSAPLKVSVNLSSVQLQYGGLLDDVRNALITSGLPASRLVLEITETVLLFDTEAAIGLLGELKSLGVGIAIDDFGTGYSSLTYLRRLPVDILKIDRSFVTGARSRPRGDAFLEAIVRLGHTLHLQTVAEGIEEAEQLEGVRDAGCDSGQGFLFARPLVPADVELLLARGGVPGARLGRGVG